MNKRLVFTADDLTTDGEFIGYAARYGEPDQIGDIILPGAFDEALAACREAGRFPAIAWEHDKGQPIGSQEIESDETGLFVYGKLWIHDAPDGSQMAVECARRAYQLLRNSRYFMSFWATDYQFRRVGVNREIYRIGQIHDTAITTHPANRGAAVSVVKGQSQAARLLERARRRVAADMARRVIDAIRDDLNS